MPISLVQEQIADPVVGGGTSLVVTPATAPTAGNLQVFMMGSSNFNTPITSIAQTNCTWVNRLRETGTAYQDLWECVAAGSPGATLTITLGGNPVAAVRGNFSEWTGNDSSAEYDAAGSGTNFATNSVLTTATVTPTAGRDGLLIGMVRKPGNIISGPTDSFLALSTGNTGTSFVYRILNGFTGTYLTTWTYTTSTAYGSVLATFLAPAITDVYHGRGVGRGVLRGVYQ